jgi:hypothetical protein
MAQVSDLNDAHFLSQCDLCSTKFDCRQFTNTSYSLGKGEFNGASSSIGSAILAIGLPGPEFTEVGEGAVRLGGIG